MTKHSTLTNADDLHDAKIRTFTGDPNLAVPAFIGQMLCNTSTNKIYRATGITTGDLIEIGNPELFIPPERIVFNAGINIAPISLDQILIDTGTNKIYRATGTTTGDWIEVVGGGSGGGSGGAISSVGEGFPATAPTVFGEMYFDSIANIFYCAIAESSSLIWRSSVPPIKISNLQYSDSELTNLFPSASGEFKVFHGIDYEPTYQRIEFSNLNEIGSLTEIESLITQYGYGVYGIGYNLFDPNNEVSNYEIYASVYLFGSSSEGSPDKILWFGGQSTHNGKNTGGFFYISKDRRLGDKVEISVLLANVS